MTRKKPIAIALALACGLVPLTLPLASCRTVSCKPASGAMAPDQTQAIGRVFERHGIVTAGIGVLRGGELVWEGYFGEQAPGVPAGAATRFNVASITKTVAAETILRLVGQGRLSLDETMAPHWVDPDLAADPRHLQLTPRMALGHRTGFPNWRFFLHGGKLAFQHAPGERYGYSGEGFEYLARFAERKLGKPFPQLAAEAVFTPLGMKRTAIEVRLGATGTIARPVDGNGRFPGYYCRPEGESWCRKEGSWSAADDMVTTVRDYAAFLASVATGEGYGPAIAAERDRVATDKGEQRIVDCAAGAAAGSAVPCPDSQGYGLGFEVLRYGGTTVLGHGGSDWAELALAYVATPSRDGLIVFLNAPNRRGLAAMPELIALLDPASPYLQQYRRWLATATASEAARTPDS